MKLLKVLLVIVLAITGISSAELAAYYSFDDSAALNRDDSGNGSYLRNIWTTVAPDYTSDGAIGGAAVFDGATQAYDTRIEYTNPYIYPEGSFTVSVWVKPDELSALASISQPGTSLVGGFILYINNGNYCAGVYADSTAYVFDTGAAATAGEWAHLALVFEVTGEAVEGIYPGVLYCYVDGVLVHTESDVFYDGGTDAISFGLGSRAGGSSKFKGSLDEFAVFSSVLTESQVYALAKKQTNILGVLDYVAPIQGPMPVAYYSFDDPNAVDYSLALDSSGNDNHLSNGYAAMPGFTDYGAVGGAAVFDGTTQGFDIKASDTNPSIYPDGSFTISLWANFDPSGNADSSITMPASTNGGYGIHTAAGTYRVNTYTVSTVTINTGIAATNVWTHLAVVFEAGGAAVDGVYSGDMYIYADGNLILEQPMQYKPDGGVRFGLGNRAGGSRFYKGMIDEFAVWQTTLSAEQIKGLANKEFTPITVPFISTVYGDINNDGTVNFVDFSIIAQNWLQVSY